MSFLQLMLVQNVRKIHISVQTRFTLCRINCSRNKGVFPILFSNFQTKTYVVSVRRFFEHTKHTYLQSRDIIICHFVMLPIKTVHFQMFGKNYHDQVNGRI